MSLEVMKGIPVGISTSRSLTTRASKVVCFDESEEGRSHHQQLTGYDRRPAKCSGSFNTLFGSRQGNPNARVTLAVELPYLFNRLSTNVPS